MMPWNAKVIFFYLWKVYYILEVVKKGLLAYSECNVIKFPNLFKKYMYHIAKDAPLPP